MATLGFCCPKLSFEEEAMFLVREDETNPKELFRSLPMKTCVFTLMSFEQPKLFWHMDGRPAVFDRLRIPEPTKTKRTTLSNSVLFPGIYLNMDSTQTQPGSLAANSMRDWDFLFHSLSLMAKKICSSPTKSVDVEQHLVRCDVKIFPAVFPCC